MNVIKITEVEIIYIESNGKAHINEVSTFYINANKIKCFKQYRASQLGGVVRDIPKVTKIFMDDGSNYLIYSTPDELAEKLMRIDNKDNSNKNKNIN